MGDADPFAAFSAMVLIAEGEDAVPVLKPDRAHCPEAGRLKAR
jgi:hypothetical protein